MTRQGNAFGLEDATHVYEPCITHLARGRALPVSAGLAARFEGLSHGVPTLCSASFGVCAEFESENRLNLERLLTEFAIGATCLCCVYKQLGAIS